MIYKCRGVALGYPNPDFPDLSFMKTFLVVSFGSSVFMYTIFWTIYYPDHVMSLSDSIKEV